MHSIRVGLIVIAASFSLIGSALAEGDNSNPFANSGVYLSLFGGVSFMHDIKHAYTHPATPADNGHTKHGIEDGYIFGGAIGANFSPSIRGEVEISHSHNSVKSQAFDNPIFSAASGAATGDVSVTNVLVNSWYDFNSVGGFKPYSGGGIGLGWVNADSLLVGSTDSEFKDSVIGFAFQVGAGAKYSLTDRIDLDVGYRFRGVPGINLKSKVSGQFNKDVSLYSHSVQFGISYRFNGQ